MKHHNQSGYILAFGDEAVYLPKIRRYHLKFLVKIDMCHIRTMINQQ